MKRLSQAVILFLLGGALLKTTLTGVFLRYVKPGLRPFLLTASLLLLATAITTLWYDLSPHRAKPPDTDKSPADASFPGPPPTDVNHDHADAPTDMGAYLSGDEGAQVDGPAHGLLSRSTRQDGNAHADDDGHGHGEHGARIGWLLALPVVALLLITPPALGSYSAAQAGTVTLNPVADYPPLPAGDPAPLGLVDYASRVIFDNGKSLGSHRVQLTGFLTPGPDHRPMLARIVLTCCAADGRPIKIGLNSPTEIDAPTGTWIQAIGTYSPESIVDPISKARIACLTLETWQRVDQPSDPYD